MRYAEYGTGNRETVILLHGGGLSWWNHRDAAKLLSDRYHVILPVLDGHADSGHPFVSTEETAARLIAYIEEHHGGRVLALGGLSLGGQIAVEMLTQKPDICRFALIESASVRPMKLTHALIRPVFGMSYGLIRQKWFSKLQAAYLGIPKALFDDYYRDTCKISKADMIAFLEADSAYALKPALRNTTAGVHIVFGGRERSVVRRSAEMLGQTIPCSTTECLPAYRHGDLSLRHPEQYVHMLLKLLS